VINISRARINFIIANILIVLIAILILIYQTWTKALILAIFKIILDVVTILLLDKNVKQAILGIQIPDKFNFGLTIKKR
jgi:hypothetical protein